MVPAITLIMAGSWGVACADTSEVKLPSPVIVAKSGKHCKDDPHCFNRYHYAIKPAARVAPGQLFVLETRDALDSDLTFDSKPQDVAAVDLNLVHPLTGPVFVDGPNAAMLSPLLSSTSRRMPSATRRSCRGSASCATYSASLSSFTGS